MKKFIFLFVSLHNFIFASPIQDHKIDPIALSELAFSLGILEDADIIYETQKRWLRKNQERWELAELSLDQKKLVLDWAKKTRPVCFLETPLQNLRQSTYSWCNYFQNANPP